MNALSRKTAVALAIAGALAAQSAQAQVNAGANLWLDAQAYLLLNAEANLGYDNQTTITTDVDTDVTNVVDNTLTNTATNTWDNTFTNDHTNTSTNTVDNTLTNTATNTWDNTFTNDHTNTSTTTNTVDNTLTNTATNTWDNTFTNDHSNTSTTNNTWDNSVTNVVDNSLTNSTTNTATNTWDNSVTNSVDTSFASSVTRDHSETSSVDTSFSSNVATNSTFDSDVDMYSSSSQVYENTYIRSDIDRQEYGDTDVRREVNDHEVSVVLRKSLDVSSDINFSGDPTISGDLSIDSAAISVVDTRQTISTNTATNDLQENNAYMADDVANGASGNLGFNVTAGDNNVQNNAASLSATDASFTFGMADAEVFVNQQGLDNLTTNSGSSNAAGLGGNAFNGATGNIAVNVASGQNNGQSNALSASVATSVYSQSSISSHQVSAGNNVSNAGYTETGDPTSVEVSLTGGITGSLGSLSGSYSGQGGAYQMAPWYPDNWTDPGTHPTGGDHGHSDWDQETDGAVPNPVRPGMSGFAMDTQEGGTITFDELDLGELEATLSGTISMPMMVAVNSTNEASLTGGAFAGASGNIGVNVASGTGNLQSNSLALAVAQPPAE